MDTLPKDPEFQHIASEAETENPNDSETSEKDAAREIEEAFHQSSSNQHIESNSDQMKRELYERGEKIAQSIPTDSNSNPQLPKIEQSIQPDKTLIPEKPISNTQFDRQVSPSGGEKGLANEALIISLQRKQELERLKEKK